MSLVNPSKVCILTSAHKALDDRIFHRQAKSLAQAGYEVTLIGRHDKDEVVDGVKIVALSGHKNRLWRMLRTWRVFRLALKEKADIYHFHDPELLFWGWRLQKLTHKPVIYDVHENYAKGLLFKSWLPYLFRKPVAWVFDKIERLLAGRLDGIVTVTEPMQARFSGYRGKCVPVHNFTSREIAAGTKESKKLDKGKHRYSVICTGGGRLFRERVLETMLKALDIAARQNSKINCVILGLERGRKSLDKEHDKLMKKLIENGNLKLMERVPYQDMFSYLDAAIIGWKLEPVRDNNSIQARVLEYMARGKPVVSPADDSLTADIIREADCGILVAPNDAKAHASAIIYLLEHPDEAKKMGEKGRKAVLEKYNWETESRKLLNLYSELLGGSHV
jgi:glycosyltransferase involved in cell wall biosynthesis